MVRQFVAGCAIGLLALIPNSRPLVAQADGLDQQYRLAAGYYSRGQWNEAEQAFEQLLRDYPDSNHHSTALFFRSEAQMQQGRFSAAYAGLQNFVRDHPNQQYSARAEFRIGEAAYRMGRYDVAVRMLEDFIQIHPQNELCQFALPYLGQLRLIRDEPQLAQRAFEATLRLHPTGPLADSSRLGLAQALQRLGNIDEAERFYQLLAKHEDPDISGEAMLHLGTVAFDQIELEQARKKFMAANERCRDAELKAKARHWLARIELEEGHNDRALQLILPLVDQPLNERLAVAVLLDGAVAANEQGEQEQALRWLQQIREEHPRSKRVTQAVEFEISLRQQRGELEPALELADRYRLTNLKRQLSSNVNEALGRQQYERKDYLAAAETFGRLINEADAGEAGSRRQHWMYLKALAELGAKQYAQANQTLEQCDDQPGDREQAAMISLARANALFGLKEFALAIPQYRSYLQQHDTGEAASRARCELAICLAKTAKIQPADQILNALKQEAASSDEHWIHRDPESFETAVEIVASSSAEVEQPEVSERWLAYLAKHSHDQERKLRAATGLAFSDPAQVEMESTGIDRLTEAIRTVLIRRDSSPATVRNAVETTLSRAKKLEAQDPQAAQRFYGLIVDHCQEPDLLNSARVRLARLLQASGKPGDLRQAQSMLQRYLLVSTEGATPLADEVTYQLAWLAIDQGQPLRGYEYFRTVVDDHPDSRFWADAAYRWAQNELQNNPPEDAVKVLTQLIQADTTPPEIAARAKFMLGKQHVKDQRWKELEPLMRGLLDSQQPEHQREARYWLAESLYRQAKLEEAHDAFQQLANAGGLKQDHRPWVALRTAQCLAGLERWDLLPDQVRTALDRYPTFQNRYELKFLLGRCLETQGRLSDSREVFEGVLADPHAAGSEVAAMAQWRIGETWFHQENYAAAIAAYYRVDSLHDLPKWRSAALLQAAKCQEHLRNPTNAEKLYRQLLTRYPDSDFAAEARERLAQLQPVGRISTRKSNQP